MKKVLVFGTFDGLHPGHLNFLEQAGRHGRVFVVVARDINVKKLKRRKPHFSERRRLMQVARSGRVLRALLGDREDFLRPIIKIQPDLIALGFDQRTFTPAELKTKLKKINLAPKIIRLKSFHPEKYKSSLIQKK
ncbi:MAG: adenylyltransferase/cytidyltransferase family protein [Candidatus Peribacteraceae bacterium]|nr:adenylyltransferase/cytidyltransferase family protein [Candidatus Peribacteraceae bacterium]